MLPAVFLLGIFFGGVWTRSSHLWCDLQEKSTHPERLWSRVLNVRLVHLSFAQNYWGFFPFLSRRHRVGRLQPCLWFIKHNQFIFFSVALGGENKNSIKSHFALAWFSLIKNLPWISFLLIPGTKQRFSLSFFPFFSSSDVGLWLVLCWSSLSSICGLLEGNINYLTCNDVINSYLARCLLINLGREGPRLTRFPAALAVLLVL